MILGSFESISSINRIRLEFKAHFFYMVKIRLASINRIRLEFKVPMGKLYHGKTVKY